MTWDQHELVNLAIFNGFLMLLMKVLKAWNNCWKKEMLWKRKQFRASKMPNPPDLSEVTTREVPGDDVPAEYLNNGKDVA